jgi:hypothetical protein
MIHPTIHAILQTSSAGQIRTRPVLLKDSEFSRKFWFSLRENVMASVTFQIFTGLSGWAGFHIAPAFDLPR